MVSEYPDISKYRVVDLKELCAEYGLSVTGRKADLQQRLREYFANNPLEEEAAESPQEAPEIENSEEAENAPAAPDADDQSADSTAEPAEENSAENLPEKDTEVSEENAQESAETEAENSTEIPVEPEIPTETETPVEASEPSVEEPAPAKLEESTADEEKMEESESASVVPQVEESPVETEAPIVKAEEPMEVEMPAKTDEESDKAAAEKAARRARRGTRWTKEAPEVKIGKMISAPAEAPVPVPKTAPDGTKLTKSQRKKLKKKRRKGQRAGGAGDNADSGMETGNESATEQNNSATQKNLKIDIDYIAEEPDLNPATLQFKKVFDAFRAAQFMTDERSAKPGYEGKSGEVDAMVDGDSEDEDKVGEATDKVSKKKLKKESRLTVAELKQIVERPDLVEMHDVTSMDPKLLVLLKSSRNTVAVPRHWSYKRKYLSGKRGIEKPPFELPEFIKKTGIMEMREALQQKEQEQSMKTKMRQRVRPKLGKIDIDYQKLHDAFFRYQTKPKMSRHGDIYYEGKEYETRLRELKPGELTDDLRTALGMPLGNNASKVPPPWLIAMQRYGPPPSYPNLKIPGLNAPIPPGCSFGYHAGGWGKPPVDERGRPLYGDVFGVDAEDKFEAEKPSENLWGEMESESDSSDDDSEEDVSEEEGDQDGTGVPTAADPATIDNGLVTPSGLSSAPPVDTPKPGEIELRKNQARAVDMSNPPPLYQVLNEKQVSVGKGMMGTSHVYDLKKHGEPGAQKGNEVSLNPEDLELDPAQIAAKYQNKTQSAKEKEDMSDMISEHLNKTARDRKRKQTAKDSDQKSKKYKDFKF